jgi:hypothetical protein
MSRPQCVWHTPCLYLYQNLHCAILQIYYANIYASTNRGAPMSSLPWQKKVHRHYKKMKRIVFLALVDDSYFTLDEAPRTRVQWNRAILLLKSKKKLGLWTLDKGWRLKNGKSRLNLHGTILEGKSICSDPKKSIKNLKGKAHDVENRVVRREVQLKDWICFKWAQIGF